MNKKIVAPVGHTLVGSTLSDAINAKMAALDVKPLEGGRVIKAKKRKEKKRLRELARRKKRLEKLRSNSNE